MEFNKMIPYIRFQKLTGIAITDDRSFNFHNHVTDNCGAITMTGVEIKTRYGHIVTMHYYRRCLSVFAFGCVSYLSWMTLNLFGGPKV